MATTAARLYDTGELRTVGYFDEVTQSTISVQANVIYANTFDEVTDIGTTAQRLNANGTYQVHMLNEVDSL
jgi:hypothetical protein